MFFQMLIEKSSTGEKQKFPYKHAIAVKSHSNDLNLHN